MTGMVLLVCCGLTVLLCVPVQAYENFALHLPAWQSSTAWSYTADRAVDGRYTDLRWSGGQCAASDGEQTAEWRVDLEGLRSINYVVIQYVTDNIVWDEYNWFSSYFLGFSVYISNTTNKEDGVLCFKDTNYTRATIPNPVNISCPYHGRYVIYYNNRTHPPFPEGYSDYSDTDLCEVEVYDCPEGLYGLKCLQNCSMTCGYPGTCNMMTGHCHGGCQVGWTGAMCEKGYHLAINNTHENMYLLKTLNISAIK
ncbi:uncharacterized protein LOC144623721 isoform X4 [Crassostrea virginica]